MNTNVTQLSAAFFRRLDADVRAGITSAKTRDFYQWQLVKLTAIAGDVEAEQLRPHHLVMLTMTNHLARAIRRLTRWAAEEDLIPKDPFTRLRVPPCGERQRTLSRSEMRRLYLSSPRPFRRYLFLMRHTMARPGEIRGLTWSQIDFTKRTITLSEFKAKKRRRDRARVRVIALDRVALGMLLAMKRRAPNPQPEQPVFVDRQGKQWSANGLRCAMRRARDRAGLQVDGHERVVCTTMRHTAATNATHNGTPQKLLAELLGHTRTSTTERYQHVQSDHLVSIIDAATARPRA